MNALKSLEWEPPRRGANVRSKAVKIRKGYIVQSGLACHACSAIMPDESMLHMHHVVPVSRGGTNDTANLALLCPTCHSKAHWIDRSIEPRERPQTAERLIELLRAA